MISFKKGSYFIYCYIKNGGGRKELKHVDGWLFEYDGIRMGVRKEGDSWNITDIKTGFRINNFSIYRKEDIEDIFSTKMTHLLNIVRERHADDRNKEIIKLVASEYDKLNHKGKHKLF